MNHKLSNSLFAILLILGLCFAVQLDAKGRENSQQTVSSDNLEGSQTDSKKYFTWDNANVYFVITDRFYNGDTNNDNSYGRGKDGNGLEYPDDSNSGAGEFQGGDLKGMTTKLREGYFNDIGVNAIWISSPVEQMHGWCGGGPKGNFRHYGYHGYYAMDWSELDKNMGAEADLMEFVDEAHSRGIRIVMDVVINHTGYATMHDMEKYGYGSVDSSWKGWRPSGDETWHSYHEKFMNYGTGDWGTNYWGTDWVRHPDIDGYEKGGGDLTMCVGFLPDIKTESTKEVGIPGILKAKWTVEGTLNEKQEELDQFFKETGLSKTVSNYMIFWIVDWVRKFGIDGFRIDTAKHVDKDVLKRLKEMAVKALRDWKVQYPDKVMNDDDFWVTGEVWGHGFDKSHYHTEAGFNSVINFGLQGNLLKREDLEGIFSSYAKVNNDRTWNGLSYLSSHDTKLYDRSRLKEAAPGFLLLPGGIQTFYGDESGRPLGTYDDEEQNTRSYMNWGNFDNTTFNVWKKLGRFRRDHPSIGAGAHTKISSSPYIFSRDYIDPVTGFEDYVIVAINANGSTIFDVTDRFPEGHIIEDYYTGERQAVVNGKVTFTPDEEGIVLLWDTDFVNVNKPIVNFVTTAQWSNEPLEIELNITDKEDDNPILYYTFDELLPTDDLTLWDIYSGSFTIEVTQTIRIVGVNKGGNKSRVNTRKFAVGPIEPFKVWLYKPSDWIGANVYYSELEPEGEGVSPETPWPGVQMTPEGNNWYSYSIKALSAGIIVFNGGNNIQQSEDLSRSSEGWYKDDQWYDACPGDCPGPQVPKVSMEIIENNTTGKFDVKINATEEGSIFYTTDGSEPNRLSQGYSVIFEVELGTTVKAIAYNKVGRSEIVSAVAKEKETLTFMWKTADKNNPSIHIWNVDGKQVDLTSWPGAAMQKSDFYKGWFGYTIEGSSANVIFNGSSGQTRDLIDIIDDKDEEKDDTVWYDNIWVSKPQVANINDKVTIRYKGDYEYIYVWGDGITSIPWPGERMSEIDQDGWYVYEVHGANCTNIVFNNVTSQTADLNICGEGRYQGGWISAMPRANKLKYGKITLEGTGDKDFVIYPNPADKYIYLSNVLTNSEVAILNTVGKVVYSGKANGNQVNIDGLKSGLYFVKVGETLQKLYVK